MVLTPSDIKKLLSGSQSYSQLGFSMLLERMKQVYAAEPTSETLEKCGEEINAFLDKFKAIMRDDMDNIVRLLGEQTPNNALTFEETCKQIETGRLLHIAGTEALLRKLPKGNWLGGSTEYFIDEEHGMTSDTLLFVTEFECEAFSVKTYDSSSIQNIGIDAYDNGLSIVIIPFDSKVHTVYAENAADYKELFMKNIIGWISGANLDKPEQVPIAVNGVEQDAFSDKAVALHMKLPANKTAIINIVNIFKPDEGSPKIEFTQDGFSAKTCLVNGVETVLADYIESNKIDTKLPLIGNYSGNGINISFKAIEDGVVKFYAPVFKGIKYRLARKTPDYAEAFRQRLAAVPSTDTVFSCNCILNFLYGELEGKKIEKFAGPVTFGEIAYQLVNQTLAYIRVTDK